MELEQIPCDQKLSAQNQEPDTQNFCTMDNQHDHYQGRRVRACFHGWEILSNHPDNILWSLWNPLTSKLIRLPPLKKEKNSYECCLSSPPDDPCSVFLLLSDTVPTIVFCLLDRKRKRLKWTEMSYAKQLRSISGEDDCFLRCPTCCNGKVYATALVEPCFWNVILVDINVAKGKEEVVINLLPFVQGPDINPFRCPSYNSFGKIHIFLKGSCTDLIFIGLCSKDEKGGIGDVYLFKLDITAGMMWEEMLDFKDAIFYVQLASDYSACYYGSGSAEVGGYVHILCERGKIIYSFCAKDRTIAISSIESQASAWAMLEWRLESESKQEEEEDKDTEIVVRPVDGDSDQSESHLLNIPVDVLQMIMELCVGREYMRFRATCKHCYLAAPPIQWSSTATLRRLQAYSLVSPLLLVFDNYRGIITFIDPTRDDRYFVKAPQELKGGDYQIYCSRYGWLLMYEVQGPMVFFNPFTRNIRKLPVLPYLDSFCFSAPPTSPDCMVVGFRKFRPSPLFFLLVSRDLTWRTFRLDFGDDDPYSYHFPIFKDRDVYALCNNKGVDVFKFQDMMTKDDDYDWEAVLEKVPISGCKSPTQYFLSSCDQHLLLVVVGGEFGESVEVFKANDSTEEEWEKIDNLGKHVIYISDTSCICFEAKSPEMENKIYFPRLLHNQGTKIVFYSLQTCRFHTVDDKQGFGVDLLTTKHHCNPHTWIEPTWS